jgi:3-hydroxyisobutyrate dehydrogenase
MKIAFIGLGNMGGPMALNLHRAGHVISAFDLSTDACARVAAEGVRIAATAIESVADAEVVVSMLPASAHVESLYFGGAGKPGLMDAIPAGALVIDCSTIAAATSRKVAEAGAARGLAVIDAPVPAR